jgi:hypothetical protein
MKAREPAGVLVSNLVAFLSTHDLGRLSRLRKLFPGDAERAMLDTVERMAPLKPLLRAQVHLAISTLERFLQGWAMLAPAARSRLDGANTWSFWASASATVGSSSSLGFLITEPHNIDGAAWASAVAVAGSLIALTVKYLRRDIFGGDNGLPEKYRALSDSAATAGSLVRSLQPHIDSDDSGDDPAVLDGLLKSANKLAGEVQQLLAALPSDLQASF